jgi:hypothetical protein
MSDPEDFFARWSRRKREAKTEESSGPSPEASVRSEKSFPDRPIDDQPNDVAGKQTTPAFDLSKLPSLDSIGPNTDIRMFVQPGVPGALSREALRRAWSADPAIRDFVGLSENSWDFTRSDSIEGFGPLQPADNVRQLLAQIFNDSPAEPDKPAVSTGEAALQADAAQTQQANTPVGVTTEEETAPHSKHGEANLSATENEILHRNRIDDASQRESSAASSATMRIRRKHGGALPT